MSRENHLLRTKNWPGNYWRIKKLDIKQWSVTSVIILPIVLPAWLITKRYITHLKNHFTVPNVAKGSETNLIYISIIRPPAKTKWKRFNALFAENVFRINKILGSIMIISIKTLKDSPVNHVVKSLGKRAHSAFILESNTLILTCPFRNGVVKYARTISPFKSLKRTHKVG